MGSVLRLVLISAFLIFTISLTRAAESSASTNTPPWLSRPLSLTEAIDLAVRQNAHKTIGLEDRAVEVPEQKES